MVQLMSMLFFAAVLIGGAALILAILAQEAEVIRRALLRDAAATPRFRTPVRVRRDRAAALMRARPVSAVRAAA